MWRLCINLKFACSTKRNLIICDAPLKSNGTYLFIEVRGIDHSECLPPGQTINQQVYDEILWSLLRSVPEKRKVLRQKKSWLISLRQYTCSQWPEQPAVSDREKLCRSETTSLNHWILLSATFFVFSKFERNIKRTSFEATNTICSVTTELRDIQEEPSNSAEKDGNISLDLVVTFFGGNRNKLFVTPVPLLFREVFLETGKETK